MATRVVLGQLLFDDSDSTRRRFLVPLRSHMQIAQISLGNKQIATRGYPNPG